MNTVQSICAASGPAEQLEQIDWSQCEQKVRRLQARVVKATQEGRHGKVSIVAPSFLPIQKLTRNMMRK